MEALAFICVFFLLPIWGGYTGDNMLLWIAVALLLLLPMGVLAVREAKGHDRRQK